MLVTHPATAFRPVRSPAFAVTSRQISGWSVMAILQPSAPSPPWPLASQGESRLLMPSESSPATGPVCSPPRRTEQGRYLVALSITPRWLALSIGRQGGGDCFEGRAGRYSCYAKSRADRIRNPMPGPVPPDHAASRLATVRVCAGCVQEGSGETPWPSLSTPPPIKAIPALPAPGVGAGWGYWPAATSCRCTLSACGISHCLPEHIASISICVACLLDVTISPARAKASCFFFMLFSC